MPTEQEPLINMEALSALGDVLYENDRPLVRGNTIEETALGWAGVVAVELARRGYVIVRRETPDAD